MVESILHVDRVEKADGSPVELTGLGTAKTSIHFNGTGTVSIIGSVNISSLTDSGTGQYSYDLINSMADNTYQSVGSTEQYACGAAPTSTVSKVELNVYNSSASFTDKSRCNNVLFGGLA
jgi:hypothetical protein